LWVVKRREVLQPRVGSNRSNVKPLLEIRFYLIGVKRRNIPVEWQMSESSKAKVQGLYKVGIAVGSGAELVQGSKFNVQCSSLGEWSIVEIGLYELKIKVWKLYSADQLKKWGPPLWSKEVVDAQSGRLVQQFLSYFYITSVFLPQKIS